ncbi:MAG: hypothetical protein HUU50_18665 [Candidatus Brocadiae bacterium]|nr:hypothetical protein [Candidatus Brocadiia bacterium]
MFIWIWAFCVTVLLVALLFWTYREERELNKHAWKRNGQTCTRLSWKDANGRWRTLKFDMPVQEVKKLLGMAKNEKLTTKRV